MIGMKIHLERITIKQDKGVIKRYIVTPDKHAPLHDKKAISVVKQAIEIIKPDGYVDLGDLGEWESVSHWQWKHKKKPPLEYIIPKLHEDIDAVNELLNEIDVSLNKAGVTDKRICMGNHEEWVSHFITEHPYLKEYTFSKATFMKERGYKVYKPGIYFKIGKLYYYHGHHFAGQYHASNHLRKLGASVIYGHHHNLQASTATGLEGLIEAWSIGCLKDMSGEKNKWLKGRPHQWVHAFAIVDYYDKGDFSVTTIKIVNGKTSLWGSLLKG